MQVWAGRKDFADFEKYFEEIGKQRCMENMIHEHHLAVHHVNLLEETLF